MGVQGVDHTGVLTGERSAGGRPRRGRTLLRNSPQASAPRAPAAATAGGTQRLPRTRRGPRWWPPLVPLDLLWTALLGEHYFSRQVLCFSSDWPSLSHSKRSCVALLITMQQQCLLKEAESVNGV